VIVRPGGAGGVGGALLVALEPQPASRQVSDTATTATAAHARFRVALRAAIGL
jgi:hypothetical protein